MSDKDKTVTLSGRLGRFKIVQAVDARYPSGQLKPVFPALLTGSAEEENYIERMIRRDREANWG